MWKLLNSGHFGGQKIRVFTKGNTGPSEAFLDVSQGLPRTKSGQAMARKPDLV